MAWQFKMCRPVYKKFGYKWDTISETVNEGMNQIVFLNDGKVVCYLYGYPENNGYGIFFESENYKDAGYMISSINRCFLIKGCFGSLFLVALTGEIS
ncbi:hypothetical protein P4630_14245 [Peribacillus simplex]|uniref:hypothetical protein n=1 Tax=Peribacillus simplex TaxID=1478 RepID=UPI002E23C243|nr:hypothetical protein [Peribacillus simplex]